MKQFLIKCILAGSAFMVILYLSCFIGNRILTKYDVNVFQLYGFEVNHSIYKSKKHTKVKKLLLGDSVANQLYSNNDCNGEIYSLTSTQAITVAGQFFLLNNFLESNKDNLPDEVIFLYSPFSLGYNFDKFSYHYFLKPFFNQEYINYFDKNLLSRVELIPQYKSTQLLIIKCSNYSPRYEIVKDNNRLLSPITQTYLEKIIDICAKNGISLKLVSTPIRESRKQELNNLQANYQVEDKKSELIRQYLSTVTYYDDEMFGDPSHFKKEFVPKDYLNLNNLN